MSYPPRRSAGIPERMRTVWERTYRETAYRELPWFSPRAYYWVVRAVTDRWLTPPKSILDLGCGAGTNSLFLARSGFRVSGVDLAPRAVEVASRRAHRAKLTIDFRVADVLNLPYPSRTFAGAIDVGCFHTIPRGLRRAYAEELSRVLAPRGRYALSWIGPEHTGTFGPPLRPSLQEVVSSFEPLFVFQTVEFHPQDRRGTAHYTARLERRERRRPSGRLRARPRATVPG
jgi:SAM-dependent methyltransferase